MGIKETKNRLPLNVSFIDQFPARAFVALFVDSQKNFFDLVSMIQILI